MRALSLMIKPASGSCNLRCRYCFYADITDIREVKNHGIMSVETLELVVEKALAASEQLCAFGFQGGEPTLAGLDFFRELIRLEQKHNTRRIKITHAIQTNGILLDEEWAEFFAKNHFLVGLSVDASKQVHDELRPDSQGKGTHNRCMKAARLLRLHNVEFNILSVVTRQLAAHPEKAYRFYRQQGFRYLQLIPCLDGLEEEHGSNDYSLDAVAYGKFLCRFFDLWYDDFVKGDYISVRGFDNYIHMLAGHPPENCAMAGACNAYPLVEADGSVYPCDFYAVDSCLLGSVADHSFEELLSCETARAFTAPSRQLHPDCGKCVYLQICRGGCRRDREPLRDGVLQRNHLCEGYRMFFDHALPRMRQIARQVFGR